MIQRLYRAGVSCEGLVEMLQSLNMNLTLVRTCGLVPFDAHDVRYDISWYVNLLPIVAAAGFTIDRINCASPFHRAM